jgi:methylthioribose-1-phosphate isomerase
MIKSVEWCGDSIRFIDQTKLPLEEIYIQTSDLEVIADATRKLKIRGAPLIGITAAYAVAIAAIRSSKPDYSQFKNEIESAIELLASTRPTAINLFWALNRMRKILTNQNNINDARSNLTNEAVQIHDEDRKMCERIGEYGSELIPVNARILTHCNTGALATGGEGTAQSIIVYSQKQGKQISVFADETRPLLQGARLTTWELMKNGIDVTLITDGMAAFLMQQKKVDLVVTGADRVAANGDTANKIGTYSLAVNAKLHNIPFYIAAPVSTIDIKVPSGSEIPIEERNSEEVTKWMGKQIAPDGVKVYSPAFDITPASLISAIVTDGGIFYPPYNFCLRK